MCACSRVSEFLATLSAPFICLLSESHQYIYAAYALARAALFMSNPSLLRKSPRLVREKNNISGTEKILHGKNFFAGSLNLQ